jgi:hypothetical protein
MASRKVVGRQSLTGKHRGANEIGSFVTRRMFVFLRCGRRIYDQGFAGLGGGRALRYLANVFERFLCCVPASGAGAKRIIA